MQEQTFDDSKTAVCSPKINVNWFCQFGKWNRQYRSSEGHFPSWKDLGKTGQKARVELSEISHLVRCCTSEQPARP